MKNGSPTGKKFPVWKAYLLVGIAAAIGFLLGIIFGDKKANADEFELKDGSTYEGKIIAQMGEQYLLQTDDGQVRIDISRLKRIHTSPALKVRKVPKAPTKPDKEN